MLSPLKIKMDHDLPQPTFLRPAGTVQVMVLPVMSPSQVKEGLFDGLEVEDDLEIKELNESDILRGPSTNRLVSKLTKFVLMKD